MKGGVRPLRQTHIVYSYAGFLMLCRRTQSIVLLIPLTGGEFCSMSFWIVIKMCDLSHDKSKRVSHILLNLAAAISPRIVSIHLYLGFFFFFTTDFGWSESIRALYLCDTSGTSYFQKVICCIMWSKLNREWIYSWGKRGWSKLHSLCNLKLNKDIKDANPW